MDRRAASTDVTEQVDRGPKLFIMTIIMTSVAGFVVLARWAIRISRRGLGWDDWCINAAMISSVILAITECEAVNNGYGRHFSTIQPAEATIALKWFYAAQIFYKLVITFNKVSVLAMYLRIFPQPKLRWLCHIGNAIIALAGFSYVVATIFQCTPVHYFWNKDISGTCIAKNPFWLSYALVNILTDVFVVVLPMHAVWKLQLRQWEKISCTIIFLFGFFVTATSIVRATTLAGSASGHDPTWDPLAATVWSVIEANTGTICACLPSLKPLLLCSLPNISHSKIRNKQPYAFPRQDSDKFHELNAIDSAPSAVIAPHLKSPGSPIRGNNAPCQSSKMVQPDVLAITGACGNESSQNLVSQSCGIGMARTCEAFELIPPSAEARTPGSGPTTK